MLRSDDRMFYVCSAFDAFLVQQCINLSHTLLCLLVSCASACTAAALVCLPTSSSSLPLQSREQLQALSGLRAELAFLQSALTQHKHHQQQHKVQEACAEADRQQEVSGARC